MILTEAEIDEQQNDLPGTKSCLNVEMMCKQNTGGRKLEMSTFGKTATILSYVQ